MRTQRHGVNFGCPAGRIQQECSSVRHTDSPSINRSWPMAVPASFAFPYRIVHGHDTLGGDVYQDIVNLLKHEHAVRPQGMLLPKRYGGPHPPSPGTRLAAYRSHRPRRLCPPRNRVSIPPRGPALHHRADNVYGTQPGGHSAPPGAAGSSETVGNAPECGVWFLSLSRVIGQRFKSWVDSNNAVLTRQTIRNVDRYRQPDPAMWSPHPK